LTLAALWLVWSVPLSAATFKGALDHAWATNAPAQTARAAQFDAQESAARAWLPEPPTLTVSRRSDEIDLDKGMREWEAELGLPLWLWGQRDRARAVAQGERAASLQGFVEARWQLAGELREAWWEARLAESELLAAELKLKEATRLEADVARRVKAGYLAPLDLNLARNTLSQAQGERLRARTAALRAQQLFRAVARGAALPDQDEQAAAERALEQHPQLASLSAKAAAAQARLHQASGDTRNNPELALSLIRERDNATKPYQNQAKVALKIPFGSASRNQPRITAANAELLEAQLALEAAHRKLEANVAASRTELDQTTDAEGLQQQRLQRAEQNFAWVEKAFQAGQLDLPAMIRAETELADARLQAARARIEAARAVSRYNQAVGALP
jgi:cobalt-zinc-cadmium efflux system outer membrane protein